MRLYVYTYRLYLFVFKDAVEEGVHVLADDLVIARRPAHAALASACRKGVRWHCSGLSTHNTAHDVTRVQTLRLSQPLQGPHSVRQRPHVDLRAR